MDTEANTNIDQYIELLKQLPKDSKHKMRCVIKNITYDTWLDREELSVYKEASESLSKDVLLGALK